MSERYQIHATRAACLAAERALWGAYYARECTRRGLRAGVDSIDRRAGRVLPLAGAVTTQTGVVELVAGVQLLRVPGDEVHNLAEAAPLVERAALPQAVRDALDESEGQTRVAAVR